MVGGHDAADGNREFEIVAIGNSMGARIWRPVSATMVDVVATFKALAATAPEGEAPRRRWQRAYGSAQIWTQGPVSTSGSPAP